MAHYLVTAKPKFERLEDLLANLRKRAYVAIRPFGKTMTHSLERDCAKTVTPCGKRKAIVRRRSLRNAPPLSMN
jgi:hypothetical protein